MIQLGLFHSLERKALPSPRNLKIFAICTNRQRIGIMQTTMSYGQGRIISQSDRVKKTNTVKVVDLYAFTLEVSREEAATLNQVTERVKTQGQVWWAVEAHKGSDWFLQSDNHGEGNIVSQFSRSLSGSGQLRNLIRKGIPPALRPKVWRAVSGSMKKRSPVPDTYYQDLIEAVEGRETPATKQIDHVQISPFTA